MRPSSVWDADGRFSLGRSSVPSATAMPGRSLGDSHVTLGIPCLSARALWQVEAHTLVGSKPPGGHAQAPGGLSLCSSVRDALCPRGPWRLPLFSEVPSQASLASTMNRGPSPSLLLSLPLLSSHQHLPYTSLLSSLVC